MCHMTLTCYMALTSRYQARLSMISQEYIEGPETLRVPVARVPV